MKIDMHIHCAQRSLCSSISETQIIDEAIASGLDAIVFTDHHRHVPPTRLDELRALYPMIQIYSGIEMTVPERGSYEGEDILLLGVHDPILETRPNWSYPELYEMTKACDGYLHLCHPMRYHDDITIDVDKYPPDAIEVGSANIGRDDHDAIRAFIEAHHSRATHASDAHYPNLIGVYHIDTDAPFHTERELIAILRAGAYRLCSFPDKVDAYNVIVREREAVARAMLDAGQTPADFERATGKWRGYCERVARGKSYVIL